MPDKAPFILKHPTVKLGAATPGPQISIECSANEIHTNVAQDENTVDTFCGSYTSYKPEKWDVTLAALQSFGTDGLWNQVRPLVGTVVPFEILPDGDTATGVDNPKMTGDALVKAFPFLDGAVGEASSFDLVLAVQGDPLFVPPDTETLAATSAPSDTTPTSSSTSSTSEPATTSTAA
jgi:hypothetical protein